jgi:hypothetical protein
MSDNSGIFGSSLDVDNTHLVSNASMTENSVSVRLSQRNSSHKESKMSKQINTQTNKVDKISKAFSTFSLLISLNTLFGSFPIVDDKSNSKKNIFRKLSFIPRFASMIIQLNSVLLIGNLTLNISFISLLDTCVSDSS